MSVVGLLIALAGFGALALFIAAPLLERSRRDSDTISDVINPADELSTAYARIKTTLRDLDEDFDLGKLDGDTYQAERARWLTEGAQVLAALDAAGKEKDEKVQEQRKS